MYLPLCVGTYVCITTVCRYVRTYMYLPLCVGTYVRTYVFTTVCRYIRMYVCMYMYVYLPLCVCTTYLPLYVCTYVYIFAGSEVVATEEPMESHAMEGDSSVLRMYLESACISILHVHTWGGLSVHPYISYRLT